MLHIENLSKDFTMHIRGGIRVRSFTDVSLSVEAGKLLAITGPSGIGKSSLLKCVYRTYLPTSGDIWYTEANGRLRNLATDDERIVLNLRRAEIGYVAQFLHTVPRVSALDILMEPLLLQGVPEEEARDTATGMLEKVGMVSPLIDMYPSTFSGGEKQRLNILHAIIAKPRLLLLDEPTASLDRMYKTRVMDLILELKAQGTGMLGVFHDQDALTYLSDDRYDMQAHQGMEEGA